MPGYLGEKISNKVHHLAEMQNQCLIYEIKIKNRKYFTPDTLKQAKQEGFVPCTFCIGNSE